MKLPLIALAIVAGVLLAAAEANGTLPLLLSAWGLA